MLEHIFSDTPIFQLLQKVLGAPGVNGGISISIKTGHGVPPMHAHHDAAKMRDDEGPDLDYDEPGYT